MYVFPSSLMLTAKMGITGGNADCRVRFSRDELGCRWPCRRIADAGQRIVCAPALGDKLDMPPESRGNGIALQGVETTAVTKTVEFALSNQAAPAVGGPQDILINQSAISSVSCTEP